MGVTTDKSTLHVVYAKPLRTFLYSRSVPNHAVNIAYVETEEVDAKCVLNIDEGLNTFPENRDLYDTDIEYLDSSVKSYAIKSRHFNVTDQYDYYNNPLFFKHELRHSVWVDHNNSTSIVIRDSYGVKVDPRLYSYNPANHCIYHNLESIGGDEPNVYSVHYIYADSSNNIVESNHDEILNSTDAYIMMDLTMLDCINSLAFDADGYKLSYNTDSETVSAYPYVVSLPNSNKWAIKYVNTNGIRLYYPYSSDITTPWYLRVSYDVLERFFTSLSQTGLEGHTTLPTIYTVLEYEKQNFNPYPPYALSKLEKANYINETTIQTNNTELLVEVSFPLEVLVTDPRGNYKYAFSTNVEQSTTIEEGLDWLPLKYDDIDRSNGFINLRTNISYNDEILVTYYYKNKHYTITAKNFNPSFDNANFLQDTLIYCRPFIHSGYTTSNMPIKSIFFISFHHNGEVFDLAESWGQVCDDPAMHVDPDDLNSPLVVEDKQTFLDDYVYPNSGNLLVLGSITTDHKASVDNTVVMDSRSRGGGVTDDEAVASTLELSYPESRWYWDLGYYDGMPFPGAAACVVYIPDELTVDYTEEEIREKVRKHMALGIYPVIRYLNECGQGYGATPYGYCPYGE